MTVLRRLLSLKTQDDSVKAKNYVKSDLSLRNLAVPTRHKAMQQRLRKQRKRKPT